MTFDSKELDIESGAAVSKGDDGDDTTGRKVPVYSDDIHPYNEPKSLKIYHHTMRMFHGETRGVDRVPEEEKTHSSVMGPTTLWFAINMVIAAYALGALSYPVFNLDFGSSVLTVVFFNILGALPVAFFSIFGARFGLRQMVMSRFLIGNVGMRIFALFNCVACVGWAAVNTMSSAQLLHIVNNGALPPWAGCVIVIALTIFVSFFGYNLIHAYERWSWIPNTICFIAIIARFAMAHVFKAGIQNADGEWVTWGSGPTLAGNILSFGGAVFGYSAGWATYAADYTTYMRSKTSSWKIFLGVFAGVVVSLSFTEILGAACITGIKTSSTYAKLYDEYSVGGLIYAILVQDSLHGFGQFLCVLLALSTVCNNIPNMYSIALGVQSMWSQFAKVPRVVWTVIGNGLILAICIPGYYDFAEVVDNFMNLIGYYIAIYISVSLTEHFVFRRGFSAYHPEDYKDITKLNPGYAGAFSFFCGVAGAVLGMNQTWYQGVLASKIGADSGDIGFEVASGFSFVSYLISRSIELKYFGR
ncbi:hypothetical protein FOA43_004521 [Brettanomyces nanus]|uniref:Purine-cytosine permease n=1 Tax=Eeniella nana TaxID=13502 RepID=A0A875RY01_EENNA|nr:uncharacterized protein FOA43_004521 [Brettanomyces nanus]QPG77117.1 hypothetical protein FOA43_004521 [Brettanomyces nanus]